MRHHKFFSFALVLVMAFSYVPSAHAKLKEATSSLLLPTTGQAMNGQFDSGKTKFMAGVEVAAITAITVIGFAGGGPAVWFGAGPLAANHIYSSLDAYKNAGRNDDQGNITIAQQEMIDAQRNIEYSRERRFDREESYRSDLRERIRRAGEQAGR